MDLKKFIGESTEYDKKQAVEMKKPKSWLKSVSAFANTVGGVLIFGITDDEQMIALFDIRDFFVHDGMVWIRVEDKLMQSTVASFRVA